MRRQARREREPAAALGHAVATPRAARAAGTLTPIVSNPDAAFMSEEMRGWVRRVAELFPTAIISGRGREKVGGRGRGRAWRVQSVERAAPLSYRIAPAPCSKERAGAAGRLSGTGRL